MAAVVQAVLIESSTVVAASITAVASAEFKTVENSVAKEVIAAHDEPPTSLLTKLEDGAAVVAKEVTIGAQNALKTVEDHPELLAEGGLAIVLGAATLIQPELAAGEVALIGKMAADSAKKTVQKIASDTGSGVVKAISKDLADDAAAEKAKDVAAAKLKAESLTENHPLQEVNGSWNSQKRSMQNTDSAWSIVAAATVVPANVDEGEKKVDPDIQDKETSPPSTAGDKTVSIEIASEASKITNTSGTSQSEHSAAAPVSLQITIGADGEVKAVSKKSEKETSESKEPSADTVKSTPTPEVLQVSERAKLPSNLELSVATAALVVASTSAIQSSKDGAQSVSGQQISATPTKASIGETAKDSVVIVDKASASTILPDTNPTSSSDLAKQTLAKETSSSSTEPLDKSNLALTSKIKPTITPTPSNEEQEVEEMVTISQKSLDHLHHSESNVFYIKWKETLIGFSNTFDVLNLALELVDYMLTNLEIDAMHVAIQEITKLLALHLPHHQSSIPDTPPPTAGSANNLNFNLQDENIIAATESSPRPTDQQDTTAIANTEQQSKQKTNPSGIGGFGKGFWPFSRSTTSITTTTKVDVVKAVHKQAGGAPDLIKAPTVTTSEVFRESVDSQTG